MDYGSVSRGRILSLTSEGDARVVLLDGRSIRAECRAEGDMPTCWTAGTTVEVSRKAVGLTTTWTLERIYQDGWIGVNPAHTLGVVREAIETSQLTPLAGYTQITENVAAHGGTFDLVLAGGNAADVCVDVRNVTRLEGDIIRYPDMILNGSGEHLAHLETAIDEGCRAAIVFAVNRTGGAFFEPGFDSDPVYSERLEEAADYGVELIAVRVRHAPNSSRLGSWATLDGKTGE